MSGIATAAVAVGAGIGYLQARSNVKQAKNNLATAEAQAVEYNKKSYQTEAAASVEAAKTFKRGGEIKAERHGIIAARGIDLGSQVVQGLDENDAAFVKDTAVTILANAFLESSALRAQGRIDVSAAQSGVDAARRSVPLAVIGGGLSGGLKFA